MNPFRFLLLPFAAMLLCVSCGQKQPASTPESGAPTEVKPQFPIHIQLSGSHEYKNTLPFTTLTDIATDIRYIPLETTPDCLIGGLSSQPQFSQDFIFIASGGILMQFDQQGKFIRRINKLGKGPENCSVQSYGIDEKNRLIYVFDVRYRDIHTFTFEGEHIKTLRNPLSGNNGFVYDKLKGNLILTDFQDGSLNEPYKYVVIDTAGTILYKSPNYIQYHLQRPSSMAVGMVTVGGWTPRLYRYNASYYYQYEHNDTIFVINEDYSCSPAYIRSLPNQSTLEDRVKAMAGVIKRTDLYGKNYYTGCSEDGRYVYLYHVYTISRDEGIPLLSLYEKATGTLIENINPPADLLNNWDGGMDLPFFMYSSSDEHQICLQLDPYKMKETLTAEHFSSRKIAHPDK